MFNEAVIPQFSGEDPVEMMMRREAVETAVSRFAELPTTQRSVVILKDVLDQSLEEIAAMLDLTVNAVKAHLARGRARLKAINAEVPVQPAPRSPSPDVARYVALFNRRDWDGLRAMLLQSLGKAHYIRKDLQCYLEPGYHNPLRVQQHH